MLRTAVQTAVLTEDLRRRFGDEEAVAGVDLAVAQGEVYGFLGPNGAGKTTCLRVLCTLLAPTSGRAVVAGYDVVDQPAEVRLRIGVALQDAALDDRQTGRELLRLQARLYGLRRAEIDRRVQELTGLVDIGDALDRRIGTYSGGMKRRIDLAAALVHNPEVLFLDEPTTGLDPISRAKVWEEVRRLNTELGMTIFLTTQYLEEADTLAGRVGIIDRGRLVAEGTPAELKRSIGTDVIDVAVDPGQTAQARQGVSRVEGVAEVTEDGHVLSIKVPNGAAAVTPLALALNEAGVNVHSLTLRTPTLDDVFLRLTGGHIEEGSR
jgi:ABC-2 type transport system ATP-binding protein